VNLRGLERLRERLADIKAGGTGDLPDLASAPAMPAVTGRARGGVAR